MDPEELKVEPLQEIMPAWRRLQAWVRTLKVIPAPGIKISTSDSGTRVTVSRIKPSWSHPWKTSIGTDTLTIKPGTLNGRMPYVRDDVTGKLVRIDGRDDSGARGTLPVLAMDRSKSKDGQSLYVALRVLLTDDNIIPDAPEAIEVVLLGGLTSEDHEGGDPDYSGSGYHPIAKLYLDPTGAYVDEIMPISHHNLAHRFIPGSPGRHLFFPV